MSCAPDMMKIQTFRSERDMDSSEGCKADRSEGSNVMLIGVRSIC